MLYAIKVLISATIIVIITEVAKKSPQLAAIVGSLPLVSLIAITWMYYESGDKTKSLQDYSFGVFWYVLPSLVFFLLFPICLNKLPFWGSMLIACTATFLAYLAMTWGLGKFGVKL